jgi:hypothetical protein
MCLSNHNVNEFTIQRLLDLQLPVQSVPITTKVVSSNTAHGEVHSIQHHVIKFDRDILIICLSNIVTERIVIPETCLAH